MRLLSHSKWNRLRISKIRILPKFTSFLKETLNLNLKFLINLNKSINLILSLEKALILSWKVAQMIMMKKMQQIMQVMMKVTNRSFRNSMDLMISKRSKIKIWMNGLFKKVAYNSLVSNKKRRLPLLIKSQKLCISLLKKRVFSNKVVI